MTSENDEPKEDTQRDFKDTQQEIMIDLKLKTDELMKKFKKLQKSNRIKYGNI